MEILWFLIAVGLLVAALAPLIRRRRDGRLRLVPPGSPDAADPADYGFALQEELDVRIPGPDRDLMDALAVVQQSGQWQAASQLLAGTPKDGELRWQRVQAFAGAAALELAAQPGAGASWLKAWRLQAEKDAGGAQVHAELLVQQAWRHSGGVGSEDHRIILEEAREACRKAVLLAPGDPVPYITELAVARALGYSEAEFDGLWAKVIDVAPNHMGAHLAALHYWCEKWHGSREKADSFAHAAAARAPHGSLLAALPLFAVYEHKPDLVLGAFWQSAVVTRAVEGALYAVHQARPDDPMLAHVRHLLLSFLVPMERWAEAMEQVRHVDGCVGALPWSAAQDPAAEYAVYRALAVAGYEANGGSPATLPH
ncbi:hypothetical protein HYE82_11430 [Streptomyces sp. BR123]|jgi:hypothetical protein|uniref:hypothetical protein n=1 Tax=Streptomyces sp. BR123 TaxID=2749828 RepID=UPI0015C43CFF|nr:hypothetical protein [Streptomyces sp. BR123]NXY94996.1 hypothetical protein [Streptomyces sp. BR123]